MKVTLASLVVVMSATSVWGGEPLPSSVEAALKRNAACFSKISVEGERSRRFLASADTVLNTLRTLEREAEFSQRLYFTLRLQGSKFRESIDYPPGDSSIQDKRYETSFDGETLRLGFWDVQAPESSEIHIYNLTIAAEEARKLDNPRMFDKMEFWYLCEAGFIGPQTLSDLGQPVKSMVLNAADRQEIVSVSEVAGGNGDFVEVVIEEPEPWQSAETFDIEKHEEYLSMTPKAQTLQMSVERERRQLAGKRRVVRVRLNRALGYALEEKWVSRKDTGETMFHTKNSDFVQVGSDGVWLPKRCVIESHTYWTSPVLTSPNPLYETEIRMNKCQLGDIDQEQFRIWYDTPGIMVSDWRVKKGGTDHPDVYRVPASIDDLEVNTPGFRRWLILLNILAIAGLLGWWWWRGKRGTEA